MPTVSFRNLAARAIRRARRAELTLLFVGQTVSIYGDRLLPVALAFAVLDLTGNASDLGYAPMVVFVLLAGVWADRLPRQLVMLALVR